MKKLCLLATLGLALLAQRAPQPQNPIGQPLIGQIRITAEELKLVKVLEPTTDPKAFAERVTVNLLA